MAPPKWSVEGDSYKIVKVIYLKMDKSQTLA